MMENELSSEKILQCSEMMRGQRKSPFRGQFQHGAGGFESSFCGQQLYIMHFESFNSLCNSDLCFESGDKLIIRWAGRLIKFQLCQYSMHEDILSSPLSYANNQFIEQRTYVSVYHNIAMKIHIVTYSYMDVRPSKQLGGLKIFE